MLRHLLSLIIVFATLCFATAQTDGTQNNKSDQSQIEQPTRKVAKFTLRNNSPKSIPLIIPTVMNPNLSPMSNSGVTLRMGQKVYFKAKGKKRVLLVVDDSIADGDILEVSALLAQRKKELGL